MNIKVTDSWLREYLDTKATPQELQKYLSLCGPSIERINTVGEEIVYDIEITSNRVDMASVYGVAQEAQAILPQFKVSATLKNHPLTDYSLSQIPSSTEISLNVELTDPTLCTRFTAVLLKNVTIGESPDFMKKRLEACDIKSINNVIDISNYLMVSLGQPTHVFDFDKINGAFMKMRLSKKGEKITTLDKKEVTLPGDDIVIEDKSGSLIDLCGIMGGMNSSVTKDTKNVLLFVQTYDKKRIRRTSMTTGIRTVAATYFEKGLNEEQVGPVAAYGVELFKKYAGHPEVTGLTDIYPNQYHEKLIVVEMNDIRRLMGVDVDEVDVDTILKNLGFGVTLENHVVTVKVPGSRKDDMNIKEDVIEEVSRIYGYFNLPNNLSPMVYIKQPDDIEKFFELQKTIKLFLKHLGLHEVMNYSMISKEMIESVDLKVEDHLRLKNTISQDIEYMRSHLSPSLLKNIKENEGKQEIIEFFEIAKTYKKQSSALPIEKYKVGIIVNSGFSRLKGIVEALLRELHIENYSIELSEHPLFTTSSHGQLKIEGDRLGDFGEIKKLYLEKNKIKSDVSLAVFDFEMCEKYSKSIASYSPLIPFAEIKLDKTMEKIQSYQEIVKQAFSRSTLLKKIEMISIFKNNITLRFYFQAKDRNLTESEAKTELEKLF